MMSMFCICFNCNVQTNKSIGGPRGDAGVGIPHFIGKIVIFKCKIDKKWRIMPLHPPFLKNTDRHPFFSKCLDPLCRLQRLHILQAGQTRKKIYTLATSCVIEFYARRHFIYIYEILLWIANISSFFLLSVVFFNYQNFKNINLEC